MKLFTMYGLEKAQAASTTGDQLGQEGPRVSTKPLAPARQKLYRTAVGQLLWLHQSDQTSALLFTNSAEA